MTVYGLESEALPDGWTPLCAVSIVKALDTNGVVRLCSRYTDGLNAWEALGMLTAEQFSQSTIIAAAFTDDED